MSLIFDQATLGRIPIAKVRLYHAWQLQSASPRGSSVMAERTVPMVLMKDHAFRNVPMMVRVFCPSPIELVTTFLKTPNTSKCVLF